MSEDGKRPRDWKFAGTGVPPASAHGYLLHEVTSLDGARVARVHRTGAYVGEEILEVDGVIVDRGQDFEDLIFSEDRSRFVYKRDGDLLENGQVILQGATVFEMSPDGAHIVHYEIKDHAEGEMTYLDGVLVDETMSEDEPRWQPPWKRGPYR